MRKPTFIGVGEQKCGTTWLYECLRRHPDVFMSTPKELHFFGPGPHYPKGMDWYLSHFNQSTRYKAAGEFSTSYLSNPATAQQIFAVLGEIKIVIVIRNPTDRFISNYKHELRMTFRDKRYLSLDGEIIDKILVDCPIMLYRGKYTDNISRYFDVFGRHNVMVLIQEEVLAAPRDALAGLYRFIGVDDRFVPPTVGRNINRGIVPKYAHLETLKKGAQLVLRRVDPRLVNLARGSKLSVFYRRFNDDAESLKVSSDAVAKLDTYYAADVQRLRALLGRAIPAWR